MLRYFKYKNAFKKTFKTALGEVKYREGIVLVFEQGEIQAFGEVAPLPGFSTETLFQVETVLLQNKPFLEKAFSNNEEREIISVLDQIHDFPSLSFGLDTLSLDFRSKTKTLPLSNSLFGHFTSSIPCNSTIGLQSESDTLKAIQANIELGFGTIKIKVGKDFNKEKSMLQSIRKEFPDLKIRIDANQAWEKKEALKNLNSISKLELEYCEQPVAASDLTSLKEVTIHSDIRIAADEAVGNKNQTRRLIEETCCDMIIIKPALMGLFKNIAVTKELANTHNMEIVFTTTLDGIIGRTTSAILASGMGSKKYAHGLATGSFFEENESQKELIENGLYIIPNDNGIGSPLDFNFLEEII